MADKRMEADADRWAWTGDALRDVHAVADKPQRVQAMFARLARRYDLANRLHSFGMDRRWRRATVLAVRPRAEERVLDVACGTGELTAAFVSAGVRQVTGLDFVPEMLQIAREKFPDAPVRWVAGDALALPFADESFDVVSIGFGLRNLADPDRGLAQFHRVLRPGGRLAVLEFTQPTGRLIGAFGRFFIARVIPHTGAWITGDRDGAFRYLARSVDSYFTFAQLRQRMSAAGFVDVCTAVTMSFGAVGVHVGVRP